MKVFLWPFLWSIFEHRLKYVVYFDKHDQVCLIPVKRLFSLKERRICRFPAQKKKKALICILLVVIPKCQQTKPKITHSPTGLSLPWLSQNILKLNCYWAKMNTDDVMARCQRIGRLSAKTRQEGQSPKCFHAAQSYLPLQYWRQWRVLRCVEMEACVDILLVWAAGRAPL